MGGTLAHIHPNDKYIVRTICVQYTYNIRTMYVQCTYNIRIMYHRTLNVRTIYNIMYCKYTMVHLIHLKCTKVHYRCYEESNLTYKLYIACTSPVQQHEYKYNDIYILLVLFIYFMLIRGIEPHIRALYRKYVTRTTTGV